MKVKLSDVRLAFPVLFEPEQYQGKGSYRYSATFLIVPGSENDKRILEAIKTVAAEKFGKKADALVASWQNNAQKLCYLDGNLKEYDGFEGMKYLSSHRRQEDRAPTVIDRNKSPLTAKDGRPYAGCYVFATVDVWAQVGENQGVRCALQGVQFSKDGDAFSGSAPASPDEFDDLGVPEAADNLV